jgi:hypothetical protein
MKLKPVTILSVLILLGMIGSACAFTANRNVEPSATPNLQATVDAGIAATTTAQEMVQATVDQAVAATVTAMPTQALPPADELTEEELAAAVDAAVTEALSASAQAEASVSSSSSDEELTEEEMAALLGYYGLSQSEIDYALSLAEMYLELYYDLGEETVALLTSVVEELESLSALTDEALATLTTLQSTLASGGVITPEEIAQLKETSQQMNELKASLEGKSSEWMTQLQANLVSRPDQYLQLQANQVADNRMAAFSMAGEYVASVRTALLDGKISGMELDEIAQLGANVTASFNSLNLPKDGAISGSINDLTSQLARGQLPKASLNLGQLEGLINR